MIRVSMPACALLMAAFGNTSAVADVVREGMRRPARVMTLPPARPYSADEARDPFSPLRPVPGPAHRVASAASGLDSAPLEALQWLGSLRSAGDLRVLLRSPDGRVHLLGLHARVALQRAEIVAVGDEELQLRVDAGQDGGRLYRLRLAGAGATTAQESAP